MHCCMSGDDYIEVNDLKTGDTACHLVGGIEKTKLSYFKILGKRKECI